MNFKKHWNGQNGCQSVITRENSSLDMLEVDMLKLNMGETQSFDEKDKEYSLIILGGNCSVTGDGLNYKNIGKRKDVFDGPATALYIPRNRKFTVSADTDVTIAVCKSPAEQDFEPVLVKPEDIIIKDLGKPGWERQAHFIIDERLEARGHFGGNLLF